MTRSVLRCQVADAAAGSSLDTQALDAATRALEAGGVGAVLLVGSDRMFCAGGNIARFAGSEPPSTYVRAAADHFHRFVRLLDEGEVPVVAAVAGAAAGAGMSLACQADVVVVGPSTRFVPAYGDLGFSPDGGLTWTLSRIVGATRAADLLLTGEPIDGARAYEIGLATRLVADGEVLDAAEHLAQRLAERPPTATRRLLKAARQATLVEQLGAEAEAIAAASDTPEGRARVRAFLDR